MKSEYLPKPSSAMRKPKRPTQISTVRVNLPRSTENGLIAALFQPNNSGGTFANRRLSSSACAAPSSFSKVGSSANSSHAHSPVKISGGSKTVDITSQFSPEDLEGMDMDAVRKGDDGSSVLRWTSAEDGLLQKAVKKFGPRDWRLIAVDYLGGTRTDVQCLHRWQKVLRPGLVKGPWTKEEDNTIINCRAAGVVKWSEIASHVKGRIGKQCRERWFNHLDPNINKSEWTVEEDRKLFEGQALLGNKWSQIAKLFLPGRPENAVKNRWNAATRRRRSSNKRNKETGSVITRTPRTTSDRPKRHQALTKVQQRFKALRPEYNIRNVGAAMEGMLTLATLASATVGEQQQQQQYAQQFQAGSMTSSGVVVLPSSSVGSNKRRRDNRVHDEMNNMDARRVRSDSASQATDLASALASIASAGRAREHSGSEDFSSLDRKLLKPTALSTHASRTSRANLPNEKGSENDSPTTSWTDSRPTGLDLTTAVPTTATTYTSTVGMNHHSIMAGVTPFETPKNQIATGSGPGTNVFDAILGSVTANGGVVGVHPTAQLSPSMSNRATHVPDAFKGRAVSFGSSSVDVCGDVRGAAGGGGTNGSRRDTADALAALHFMRRPALEMREVKEEHNRTA